jgi:hypothetical protein
MRSSAFLSCLIGLRLVSISAATLNLEIHDESAATTAARVRLLDSAGNSIPVDTAGAALAAHPRFPELGVIVDGRVSVRLPAARVKLLVERGPEYRQLEVEVDGDATRLVRLERWISMARRGWWSGDLHVHRLPQDLPLLLRAADLYFAPTITCFNDEYTLAPWPSQVRYNVNDRIYTVDNCEDERPWGAAILLGVKSPVKLYRRDAQYPSPLATWTEARERGGFIDLEKLIWWQAPVLAALSPPDTIGVAVNHFQEETVMTRASLSKPRDEGRYPGPLGFAQYVLDLYDTYLSAGHRIAASAGSANGVVRNAFGFNRSYVYLGNRFSIDAWVKGQKAGQNFVTNGPMLFVRANGRLPGTTFPDSVRQTEVEIEALSPRKLDRVEIVVDGTVAANLRADEGAIKAKRRVKVEPGSWMLVRCFEQNTSTLRFAQTSPFWFGSRPKRSPEALRFMRDWIDSDIQRLQSLPESRITLREREELLDISKRARRFYE